MENETEERRKRGGNKKRVKIKRKKGIKTKN